ncbi:MAG: pentapeptide repeat-containing protein [Acidobacteriota bacterium]
MTAARSEPTDGRTMDHETKEALVASFDRLRGIDDPVQRTLGSVHEAARLDLDPDLYQRLFELHEQDRRPHDPWHDRIIGRIVAWCDRQSLFSLLEYVGRMAIVVAILSFFLELPERQQMRDGDAWERIQAAKGNTWSGDRHEEIERLATGCVGLEGLAAPRARLEGLRLDGCRGPLGGILSGTWLGALAQPRGAMLAGADLRDAVLTRARLPRADLREAHLDGVDLSFADLAGARLSGARLVGADLFGADLSSADLTGADLTGADLSRIDLRGARLVGATLDDAKLLFADLREADASRALARRADLSAARLDGVQLLSADLSRADLHRARVDDRTVFDHVRWHGAHVPDGLLSVDQLAAADDRPDLDPPARSDDGPVIGWVVPETLDFYREVVAGAEDAAAAAGARLRVVELEAIDAETTALARVQPALAAFDASSVLLAERIAVGQLVGGGIDALVLSPRGGASSDAVLRWVFESGIPTVLYDNVASAEAVDRWTVAAYTTDQYAMGRAIGEHTARWAERHRDRRDEPWRVGLVRACDFENCFERVAGFRDALHEAGLPWNEVFYRRIRFDENAADVAYEVIGRHPEVEILWAANEGGTNALLDAIERHGFGLRMWVFGTDWSSRTAAAMRPSEPDRVLEAVVVQQPREMGRRAVRSALAALAGEGSTAVTTSTVVELPHVVVDDPDGG